MIKTQWLCLHSAWEQIRKEAVSRACSVIDPPSIPVGKTLEIEHRPWDNKEDTGDTLITAQLWHHLLQHLSRCLDEIQLLVSFAGEKSDEYLPYSLQPLIEILLSSAWAVGGGGDGGGQTNCPVGHFNKCIESLILLSRPHLEMTAIPTCSARTVKIPEDFVVFMNA